MARPLLMWLWLEFVWEIRQKKQSSLYLLRGGDLHITSTLFAVKEKNGMVKCKLGPGQKLLSTAGNTISNPSKHLWRQHANMKIVVKDPRNQSDVRAECMSTPNTQPKLDFHQVTKAEINRLFLWSALWAGFRQLCCWLWGTLLKSMKKELAHVLLIRMFPFHLKWCSSYYYNASGTRM